MNKAVKRMREDFNPGNVMDGIEKLDLEIDRLEERIPDEDRDDEEVMAMMEANDELRLKVGEVGQLVTITLTKVQVRVLVGF